MAQSSECCTANKVTRNPCTYWWGIRYFVEMSRCAIASHHDADIYDTHWKPVHLHVMRNNNSNKMLRRTVAYCHWKQIIKQWALQYTYCQNPGLILAVLQFQHDREIYFKGIQLKILAIFHHHFSVQEDDIVQNPSTTMSMFVYPWFYLSPTTPCFILNLAI